MNDSQLSVFLLSKMNVNHSIRLLCLGILRKVLFFIIYAINWISQVIFTQKHLYKNIVYFEIFIALFNNEDNII